jgi:exodeoxyribonuclease V gamma subunit
LTVSHPLQPFSAAYVQKNRDPRLFTYAKEWFESPPAEGVDLIDIPTREEKTAQLSLETLSRFLKAPVKNFCQHRLKFSFVADELTSEDNEPFGFDRLQAHVHSQNLLNELQTQLPSDISTFMQQQKAIMAGKGLLPLAGFADNAFAQIAHPAIQAWRHYQALLTQWPTAQEPRSIELSFTTDNDIRVQLSGALNQLRLNNHQQHGLLHLSAQTLVKNKTSQPHKLIRQWLQHLAACAAGLNTQSILIGADQLLTIHPLPQNQAYSLLTDLIEAWQLGLQNPLPIACRTGFVWLNAAAETAKQTAQSRYEGDDWNPGEVAYDAYLARFYPDFASLYPAGQPDFEYWADKLYRPLNQHLQLL